jgi:hypothetical protein
VSAGLLRVSIVEAMDLEAATTEYLARVHHWDRSEYRLESKGPSNDGQGEIIAAIHRDDEREGASPGSGKSLQLVLDYQSLKVLRESAFQ